MNKYFFRFITPTRLAFSGFIVHQKWEKKGIKVNYPTFDIEMMVFDKRIEKNKVFLHYGLGCDISIKNNDKEVAKKIAEETALNFLFLISFLDRAFFDIPICILSYKYPKTGLRLEEFYAKVIDTSYLPLETSLRLINLTDLKRLIEQMKDVDKIVREKIDSSLFWLWKAVGASNLIDRFINLWVCLEFLEEPLKDKYNLSRRKEEDVRCSDCSKMGQICWNCKKKLRYNANTGFSGIKTLEEKIPNLKIKFNDLFSNRSKIMHGKKHLDKNTLEDSVNFTELLIYYAISELLNNSSWEIDRMIRLPMRNLSKSEYLNFEGELNMTDVPSIDECEKQPMIYGDYNRKFNVIDDGKIETLIDVEHKIDGGIAVGGDMKKIVSMCASHNIEKVWDRERENNKA